MATFLCKKNKSSASTCTTEGSTTSSSPASSVNLVTTNSHISQQQQQQHNSVTNNNNNNAPKYGTLVPNRIFVGGISGNTTETELAQLFSAYGNVKATKVISDRAGVSKGYGFVTFETEEEAKRLMRDSECIVLKERKLNIAPAIKKQPFNRTYEAASPPTVASNTIFYQNGVPYTFHNGVAYFPATPPQHATAGPITTAGDPAGVYQTTFGPPPAAPTHSPAATAYPVIYPCTAPPTMYMTPQQFQYQPMPPPAPTSQYIYTASTSSTSAAAPGTGPPVTQGSPMLGTPAPLPPTQHYYTPAPLNPTDLYYSIPQPYPTMITNEGIVYETPPQTEASNNQSPEDSCSNSSNSDTVRSGGGGNNKAPPHQEKMIAKRYNKSSGNGGWTAPSSTANSHPSTHSQHQNSTTPVVSLLKLQQAGDEMDISRNKKSPSPIQDYLTTPPPQQQPYYQQIPPPPMMNPNKSQTPLIPVLYESMPPMFLTSSGQTSGTPPYMNQFPPPPPNMMNGHSDHSGRNFSGQFQNHRAPYASKPYSGRRNSGVSSNCQSSSMTVHIPPFPPKFHFMNSNHVSVPWGNNPQGPNQKRHFNNRNQNHRGRYMGPSGPNRMQRRFFTANISNIHKNMGHPVSTSHVTDSTISHSTATTSTSTVSISSTSATTTATTTVVTSPLTTSSTTITTNSSPPPAPYSPMTHPVTVPSDSSSSASPPQQVQFYSGAGRQTYYPPSNGTQQQLTVPPRRFVNNTRKTSGNTSNGGGATSNGGSRSNGSSNGGKYSKNVVNSVGKSMSSVDEGSLGGAGDAPTMMPPPSCGGNVSQGSVMQETCHQMQTLSL